MAWSLVGASWMPATDNANAASAGPVTVTPPTGMQSGDHVVLYVANDQLSPENFAISTTGGQTWTAEAESGSLNSSVSRLFHCIFNGTWDADPQVDWDTSAPYGIAMVVFRGGDGTTLVDQGPVTEGYAAPATPFDVTIASGTLTSVTAGAMVVAFFYSNDNNTWALQTSGWVNPDTIAQWRNAGGTDCSISVGYKEQASAGNSEAVTNRQTAVGGDSGQWTIIALKPSLTQEVTGAGNIATAQAFGTTVVDRPHVDPGGIATAQAFGTTALDLTLNPTAIASGEAFGTISALDQHVNATGIASAEAFGTQVVDRPHVDPSSIASAETFGTTVVDRPHVDPSGIASAEAFGTATVDRPHVDPAGIASAEAFGTAIVEVQAAGLTIDPAGIASAEAFGALIVDRPHVDPAAIASSEAFGLLSLDQFLNPAAVPTGEAFGTLLLDQPYVDPAGIASAQAFGTPVIGINQEVSVVGIASAQVFGTALIEIPLFPVPEETLVMAGRVGSVKLERRSTVIVPTTSEVKP